MAEQLTRTCDAPKGRGTCGARVPDDMPFKYAVDDMNYEADLCAEHREDFKDKISKYIEVSKPVSTRVGKAVRSAMRGKRGVFTTKDVRNWLRDQGYEVADSGRLPEEQIEKYREAHA